MSDLVNTSVPAADLRSTASADSIEVTDSNSPEARKVITKETNCSDVPNILDHTEPASSADVSNDAIANAACSNDQPVTDEGVTLASSAAKMCSELEASAERIDDSVHLTPAANERGISVSGSTDELCQSGTVTFNLPLEVIGACWFMKQDTETCLQAITSNDG